ncbi:MAG TPA: peptidase-C39 like family protein [Gammaproteobacteria bacterium]|nr:peptidase-C39 like family protein [Gammaproteobacteria bacterium]
MFKVEISTQPDDETCGPTSLHAVYQYYGDAIPLEAVIHEVSRVRNGGTIAPLLGLHAIQRGYEAYIYVYNLDVFDPTWFYPKKLNSTELLKKLALQETYKNSPRFVEFSSAYRQFIEVGGEIRFQDLTVALLKEYFNANIPILTGLSATYLYQSSREVETKDGLGIFDDLRGLPLGHFVILCGHDENKRKIVVADPHRENPISHDNYYKVPVSRLINSIMLGVLTYDANLLIIKPK